MAGQRVRTLKTGPTRRDGRYVLYWMQAAQRAQCNPALEHAIELADELARPVAVVFCLVDGFPEANLRHTRFMVEGLCETRRDLALKGIQMAVFHGPPEEGVRALAGRACLVVTDAGHLRIQRTWRRQVAEVLDCAFLEVEANLIVPVWEASDKENFSAATLRPRIRRQLDTYLRPLRSKRPKADSLGLRLGGLALEDAETAVALVRPDRTIGPVLGTVGGPSQAQARLKAFLRDRLDSFADLRNDPAEDRTSGLSPYLHFGQISPLQVALEAAQTAGAGKEAFLEELIVRRELAHNYVYYNPKYDQYEGLAPWARRTLDYHGRDRRPYVYGLDQFEKAATHDPYWNAAQEEMVLTGKMHGYMRMYWGKKILEWSRTPKEALDTAIHLNDKYELDGRDPNGYAGVAWCLGQHDRAWGERPVFGKVRTMTAAGLERKFDIEAYVRRVRALRPAQARP
ncbi:MAG: deoxyribodipyrimidine photo-lyase [Phycisphaerae bacterium]|nr:deoxyribodipyrimidine photo-lyase [Phycisphaerae bacterium]